MTLPPQVHFPGEQQQDDGRPWIRPAPGDRPRLSVVTRIFWEDPRYMDGHNVLAAIDRRTGDWLIVMAEGLPLPVRRAEIKKLRAELRHSGAGRIAAWGIVTTEGLRRLGFTYLRMRMAAGTQDTAAVLLDHGWQVAGGVGVVAVTATAAVAATGGGGTGAPAIGSPAWHRLHPVHVTLPVKPLAYLGVYEQTSPASYSGVETFAKTCGRQPNLALYYSGWEESFKARFANAAAEHGAIPLVQIDPVLNAAPGVPGAPVNLNAIATGAYDSYLTSYADAVASYGRAVVIGFGHEMNGSWYSWGYRHQSPLAFAAAWRHIVDVFRRQGADNVTWLWTVNKVTTTGPVDRRTGPLTAYWPGAAYVTWVGIDGYYRNSTDTWDSVFAPTIAAVHRITKAGILLSETAIGPASNEVWQLGEMYADIRQQHLLGLAWYDVNVSAFESYRLVGDRRDTAVFRQLTKPWRLQQQLKATAGT